MDNEIRTVESASAAPHASRLTPHGGSALARAWAICAKDAAQELRRRIAIASIFFFAATAVTLVSFGIGPFGLPAEARDRVCSALLWIILFFCAATGLPRAFVREEETGTAFALRKVAPASLTLAGKTLFNYLLFLAIAAVTLPAFSILLEWRLGSPGAMIALLVLAGYGLAVVSTFLAALVARASQKNVLFVVISFPLLLPLLLSAIVATVEAAGGSLPSTPLRVIVAYDGAATCAGYLLASAAWED
jgi:heme exporter protein B